MENNVLHETNEVIFYCGLYDVEALLGIKVHGLHFLIFDIL